METTSRIVSGAVSLAWAGIAFYAVWLLRGSLVGLIERVGGVEAWGLKFSMNGGQQALGAALEVAAKNPHWDAQATQEDSRKALERAKARRALFEGAEILWVDDRPSNNRNEARMLRSFGALITFACTTDEAVDVLTAARPTLRPFHIVLSDISRDMPPPPDPAAGIRMLARFKTEGIVLPVIFYIGKPKPNAGTPAGAFGVTHRPDELLNLVVDALDRARGA